MRMECGESSTRRNFIVCTSPNVITVIKSRRWAEEVARMEQSTAFRIVISTPTGKISRRKWEDNIRVYHKGKYVNTSGWIDWVHERAKLNFRPP